jgi:hypothetical protein
MMLSIVIVVPVSITSITYENLGGILSKDMEDIDIVSRVCSKRKGF